MISLKNILEFSFFGEKYIQQIYFGNKKIVYLENLSMDDIFLNSATASKNGNKIILDAEQKNKADWTPSTITATVNRNFYKFKGSVALDYRNSTQSSHSVKDYPLYVRLRKKSDNSILMEMQIQGCFRYLGNVYINPKCSLFVNGKTFTEKGNFDSSTTGYYPYVVFEVLYDKQNKSLTCKWGDDNSWDWILTALDFEYEPCYLEISGICCKMKYTSGYSTYNYGVSYTINCDLENSQNIIGYKS